MKLEILAALIQEAGLGQIGADLFKDEMPADTRTGVLLRLPLEGIAIDYELPGYFRGQVQVIVRAQTEASGSKLAADLARLLTISNREFSDENGAPVMQVNHLRPLTLPIAYKRSDGNGREWSINLDASYVVL